MKENIELNIRLTDILPSLHHLTIGYRHASASVQYGMGKCSEASTSICSMWCVQCLNWIRYLVPNTRYCKWKPNSIYGLGLSIKPSWSEINSHSNVVSFCFEKMRAWKNCCDYMIWKQLLADEYRGHRSMISLSKFLFGLKIKNVDVVCFGNWGSSSQTLSHGRFACLTSYHSRSTRWSHDVKYSKLSRIDKVKESSRDIKRNLNAFHFSAMLIVFHYCHQK